MAGHDAVVHFAAESHVDRSIAGPDDFINTNCFGTNVVMDTARRLDIERVMHIGTDEVYGSVEEGSSKETDLLEPRSPYSASKAGSDLIALSYHTTYGLPVTVTRCTNNFGPYQFPEKVDPALHHQPARRQAGCRSTATASTSATGSTSTTTAPVCTSCSPTGAPGEIYNIGAGNETPNRVLVDTLLALLGVGEEMVEYVEDRARSRPPLLRRHHQDHRARLAASSARSTKRSRRPWRGTATTAGGGNRSSERGADRLRSSRGARRTQLDDVRLPGTWVTRRTRSGGMRLIIALAVAGV